MTLSRRSIVQALAGVAALSRETLAMQQPHPSGIPRRPLGKSGAMISMIGFGGWDCAVPKTTKESLELLDEAADSGITFWDNAWEYHDGRAEEVMGQALAGSSRRSRIFLMTKVCARDYDGVRRQLEQSLKRLRTDHLDLLQFHAIQYPDDRERIFDPEKGGLKAALEARKAGKIRYLGFTGHMDPRQHLRMLAAPHEWDSVQMPLNVLDAQYNSFQRQVLAECRKRNIGALGMKSLAGQDARLPLELGLDVELCRRYALSLPVSAVICGMQTKEELRMMLRIGRNFRPLTADEVESLTARSAQAAATGRIEIYKDWKSGYGCSYWDKVLKG